MNYQKPTLPSSEVEHPDIPDEHQSQLFQILHYYYLLVSNQVEMANTFSKVAVSGIVVAGICVVVCIYNHYDRGDRRAEDLYIAKLQQLREQKEREFQRIKDELERSRRAFERENLRDVEELNRLRESRLEKSRLRTAGWMAGVAEEDRRSELRRGAHRHEREERLEKLKVDLQLDNFLKNEMMNMKFDLLQRKNQGELSDMEDDLKEIRRKNQESVDVVNERIANEKRDFEKKNEEQQQRAREEEERFERRLEEIRQKLAEDMREMYRRDAARRAEMDAQLREIHRVLRNKVWNEIIENNWTRRLNTLRSLNQDVSSAYRKMKSHSGNVQVVHEHSKNLLVAIDYEKRLMVDEYREIEKMYEVTGKLFLIDIKHAVENVWHSCDALSASVKRDPLNMSDVDKRFVDLSHASAAIPTLAELKSRYVESMKK